MGRRDLVLLLALAAIWGASFMFIKVGVEELTPAALVLGRTAVAALTLLPLVVLRGGLAPIRGHLVPIAAMGVLNSALPFWLLSFGETRVDSGLAAVIQASAPIFTALLASRIDPTQRVSGARLVGIAVGFVGVGLLVGVQEGSQLVGALAIVGTAVCYAVAVLYGGRSLAGVAPLQISFGTMLAAALLIAPFGLAGLPGQTPSAKVIASVLVLGALGTAVAYILYFGIIQRAGASRAILVTYLVPAFALVYGAVFLDEEITAVALGGLALVLGGTALATGVVPRWRQSISARR